MYKLDSSSVSWRVFAQTLHVVEFNDCLLYKSECPGETFNGTIAFDMLDALVNALGDKRRVGTADYTRSINEPTAIVVRSISEFRDRFHHFLLPTLFLNNVWRTNQALYYPPELLDRHLSRSIGAGGHLCYTSGTRPFFCNELWINIGAMCKGSSNKKCPCATRVVHEDILRRVRKFQAVYPDLTFDLSLLESQDDWQMARGGVVPVGLRRVDVASIIRGRDCSSPADGCTTVFVDEFRYQVTRNTSDADQWYFVVAVLRSAGQGYFYLRFLALVAGCYRLQADDAREGSPSSVAARARRTVTLLVKVPMQTVVYGSPFPVLCYAGAHLVDSTITYTVLSNWFLSFLGLVNFSFKQFMSLAVMQMRNVWLYALLLHTVVKLSSARRWLAWSPALGVRGVPEFLMSAVSAITISSQYRSTTFRSARIFELHEVPAALSNRVLAAVRYQHGFIHRGSGDMMLGGVIIDLKFLFCALVALIGVVVVVNLVIKALTSTVLTGKQSACYLRLWGTTPVPYSVGELWPSVTVCIQWTHENFCIDHTNPSQVASETTISSSMEQALSTSSMPKMLAGAAPTNSSSDTDPIACIQRQMQQVHTRGDQVNAAVAFMNLICITDPVVFFFLYATDCGGGTKLAYYRSRRNLDKVFLLPTTVVTEENEYTQDLELLVRVSVAQLPWIRLLQCG